MSASGVIATLLAGFAGLFAAGGDRIARSRLHPRTPGRGRAYPRTLPTGAAHAAAGLVVLLGLTGRGDLAVPLAIAVAAVVVPSRRRASAAADREGRTARDLPRVADLMATCLDAGIAPADAIVLVCDVVGGPVRDDLLPVAAAIRVGVDPEAAWSGLAAQGSGRAVRRVARAFARAAATGAPLAETLTTVADDERERLRWQGQAAARRAGVLAVGPLALCFLPAFLLLGVVPVVVGVATDVLGQLR